MATEPIDVKLFSVAYGFTLHSNYRLSAMLAFSKPNKNHRRADSAARADPASAASTADHHTECGADDNDSDAAVCNVCE